MAVRPSFKGWAPTKRRPIFISRISFSIAPTHLLYSHFPSAPLPLRACWIGQRPCAVHCLRAFRQPVRDYLRDYRRHPAGLRLWQPLPLQDLPARWTRKCASLRCLPPALSLARPGSISRPPKDLLYTYGRSPRRVPIHPA